MMKVFKIGGNIVGDEKALTAFCDEMASTPGGKVIVHGGGVMASEMLRSLGIEPVMVEGRRVTDEATLKVVTMVYAGWCNKHITALLQAAGCNAIGLSGCDGSVVTAKRRGPRSLQDGTLCDYGFVGDVTPASVNAELLQNLVGQGLTPVLCAINHDGCGGLLNTNADTVASSVAVALGAELLLRLELPGVLADRNDPSSVIPVITSADFGRLVADGTVSEGMIPKIENALKAVGDGAACVWIGTTKICL